MTRGLEKFAHKTELELRENFANTSSVIFKDMGKPKYPCVVYNFSQVKPTRSGNFDMRRISQLRVLHSGLIDIQRNVVMDKKRPLSMSAVNHRAKRPSVLDNRVEHENVLAVKGRLATSLLDCSIATLGGGLLNVGDGLINQNTGFPRGGEGLLSGGKIC